MNVIAVALGGALGAVARYLIALALAGQVKHFPFNTLLANVLGCLLIGVFSSTPYVSGRSEAVRLFLTVGLLGGFTTFSAFGLETHAMIRDSRIGSAAAYIAISLVMGLAAVFLGHRLGARIGA